VLAAAPPEVDEAIARLIGSKTSGAQDVCAGPLRPPLATSAP
jgi:hypothetical protein